MTHRPQRILAALAFVATLAVASAVHAQGVFPFALPVATGSCTQTSGGSCFPISGTTGGSSTSVIAASAATNSRALVGTSSYGVGVYGSVDNAPGFGLQAQSYYTGTALGAFATGSGIGAAIQANSGTAAAILGNAGVGADIKSISNDALTITGAGSGHSGLYCSLSTDAWCAYLVGTSLTKPALFVANGAGPALRVQGPAGGTGSWFVYSSKYFKDMITDSTFGVETVKKMHPVTYVYKDDAETNNVIGKGHSKEKQLGFIAEELQTLGIPGLVVTDPASGKPMAAYSPLDAVFAAAIKQLADRLAVAEAKIAVLESQVNPVPPPNVPGL